MSAKVRGIIIRYCFWCGADNLEAIDITACRLCGTVWPTPRKVV